MEIVLSEGRRQRLRVVLQIEQAALASVQVMHMLLKRVHLLMLPLHRQMLQLDVDPSRLCCQQCELLGLIPLELHPLKLLLGRGRVTSPSPLQKICSHHANARTLRAQLCGLCAKRLILLLNLFDPLAKRLVPLLNLLDPLAKGLILLLNLLDPLAEKLALNPRLALELRELLAQNARGELEEQVRTLLA